MLRDQILPEKLYRENFSTSKLSPPTVKLLTYSRQILKVFGCLKATVTYQQRTATGFFNIVKSGTPLIGLDLCEDLNIEIKGGKLVEPTVDCAMLSQSPRPPETTTSLDIRHAKGFVHKVQIHTDVKPVQQKLRRLPLSVCDTVTAELNELEKQGTIEGVDSSEWFSPIVVTRRKNGKIIKTRQWSPTATHYH